MREYWSGGICPLKTNDQPNCSAFRLVTRLAHKLGKRFVRDRIPVDQERVKVNFAHRAFAIGGKSVRGFRAHQELGAVQPDHIGGGTIADAFASCRVLP